ncbi:hypothetical protein AYK24_06415 [Thermoplasmatales archaeon SG8-52-4]|nr:MAG: hypothetical protein AYK24_06415 [Thermoplasmatales archaeon SG8-52-4]
MAKGQVSWFEILIYTYVRRACKNIFVKIFVHIVGLILMVLGIYLLIFTMPSLTSIMGVFFGVIGFVIFITPIGVK